MNEREREKRVVGNLQKLFFSVLMFFILVGMYGCGGSSSSSTSSTTSNEGYTITGTIVNGSYTKTFGGFYKVLFPEAFAIDSTGFPNQIDAVSDNGTLLKTFPIDTDGSFTIDTGKIPHSGAIFFVVDNKTGYVFGNLRFATNKAGIYLDYIPFSDMDSDIDMGYLSVDNLTGPNMETCGAFKDSMMDSLETLADIDDVYTLYGNNIENKNVKIQYITISYEYCTCWAALGCYNWDDFDNYTAVSKSPYIELRLEYKPNTQLPDNTSETFTMYSLDNISDNMSAKATYNAEDGSFLISMWHYEKLSGDRWQLKDQNGNIIGEFNLSVLSTANNRKYFPGFIPYIKINKDDDNNMTSMDIRWYADEGDAEKLIGEQCFDNLVDNLTIYDLGENKFFLQSVTDDGTTFIYIPDKNHPFKLSSDYGFLIQYTTSPVKYSMYVGDCGGPN